MIVDVDKNALGRVEYTEKGVACQQKSTTRKSPPRLFERLRATGHYHTVADEIVLIVGGGGDMLINGKWTPVKPGDLHVNPRGIIHNSRNPDEDSRFISIFTPQQPLGGDINRVKD